MGDRAGVTRAMGAGVGALLIVVACAGVLLNAAPAAAIPPFARRYKVVCQTCHVIIPKLNAFGEAFRINGYRMSNDDVYVSDEPLELGAEPWRDLFPNAIWPSDIPGLPPVALRLTGDMQWTRRDAGIGGNDDTAVSFNLSPEFELLTGGRMGSSIGFFGEVEWKQDSGVEIEQAYMVFNPTSGMNIRVGLMDPQFLLSNSDTTRLGKQSPLWGDTRMSDWRVGEFEPSPNRLRLHDSQAGIELSGNVGRRVHLGVGVTNGSGERRFDQDNHKDVYLRARLKIAGRDFYGTTEQTKPPGQRRRRGGWAERSLLLEGFGYWGRLSQSRSSDTFRYFGVAARVLAGDADLAVGAVHGRHDNPWFTSPATGTDGVTWFLRGEYMFYPWLMGKAAYERRDWHQPDDTSVGSGLTGSLDQARFVFGPVIAVRANVRVALEVELYSAHRSAQVNGLSRPNNLWLRMDYAF